MASSHAEERYYYHFRCSLCEKLFARLQYLQQHTRRVHGVKRHACPRSNCNKPFYSKYDLKNHVRQVHNGERKFGCSICSKSLCTKAGLELHMSTHLEVRERAKFKCQLCSKTYLVESSLLRRLRSHTGEKPYSCAVCGKGFSESANLKAHAVVHTRERPYSCPTCSKTFGHRSALVDHRKIHTGERAHQCSLCGKRFRVARALGQHMSSHTRERPYQCTYCNKSFSENKNRRLHVNSVHLGIKGEGCLFCGKAFNSKVDLFQHFTTHAKEAPYFCKICPKEFGFSGNLARHTRKVHSAAKAERGDLRCEICSREFASLAGLVTHKKCTQERRRDGWSQLRQKGLRSAAVQLQSRLPIITKHILLGAAGVSENWTNYNITKYRMLGPAHIIFACFASRNFPVLST